MSQSATTSLSSTKSEDAVAPFVFDVIKYIFPKFVHAFKKAVWFCKTTAIIGSFGM